ncbi:hypothetical protein D5086_002160 [Populus alba]|uniref:Uncharacterized protein n=1 Tax=Populus alba TaxID=43335 RepID=A0ACC4D1X6_POPAL
MNDGGDHWNFVLTEWRCKAKGTHGVASLRPHKVLKSAPHNSRSPEPNLNQPLNPSLALTSCDANQA